MLPVQQDVVKYYLTRMPPLLHSWPMRQKGKATKRFALVRLDRDSYRKLKSTAALEDRPAGALLKEAVEEYVAKLAGNKRGA